MRSRYKDRSSMWEKRPCWEIVKKHWRHFTDAPEAHIVNRIKLLLVFPVDIRVSFCSA